MKLARLLSVVAVLAVVLLLFGSSTPAHAQCAVPYGTEGFPYPGWLGYYGSPYSLGQIPVPPYFALHPPVYYSQPVPRSYGYSPYAYPGTMVTPEIVQPQEIINPHVTPKAESEAESAPAVEQETVTTAAYQIIENPFVRPELKTRFATRISAAE
jgi:hypothetical protein